MHRVYPLLGVLLFPLLAQAERVAIETDQCAVAAIGATRPAGIAYDSLRDRLAVADAATDTVYFVDTQCALSSSLSLATLGVTRPAGLTYRDDLDSYAVVDADPPYLQAFTPTGDAAGGCDLGAEGVGFPSAVAWEASTARFAVLDDASNELIFVDASALDDGPCTVVERQPTGLIGVDSGVGLTQSDPDASLVAMNLSDRRAYFINGDGDLLAEFGTEFSLGTVAPAGIAYAGAADRYYVVDGVTTFVHEVDGRGTITRKCMPGGVLDDFAIDTRRQQLILLDITSLVARRSRLSDCAEIAPPLNLAPFGIELASGVGYDEREDQYIFTDRDGPGTLYFVDAATNALVGSCNPDPVGEDPTRVNGLGRLGWLWVVGDSGASWNAILDRDCSLIEQWPGPGTNDTGGSLLTGVGGLISTNFVPGVITLATFEGRTVRSIDTRDVDAVPTRLRSLPNQMDRFLATTDNTLYEWHLPLLADVFGVSGAFARPGVTLTLFELNAGDSLLGLLEFSANQVRVVGTYAAQGNALSISFRNPQGSLVTLNGTIDEGLGVITLPPPLGRLERRQ
ncbi:MAG: hypothetical protein AAGA68_24535 [Pseudomonadota bacterium]